ncbi:MAG: hypothetical protein JSV14_16150 [Deltaproteobacteria bacterium]|nr:MAG: hypothetical protein JSV14_16150 [Deltaproteobacteria bacterium]
MLPGTGYLKPLFLYLATFFLILVSACGQKERFVGVYKEDVKGSQACSESAIELKENGRGVWRLIDDETSLTWDVRGNEIRLHTKSGGVILGTIQEDVLEVILPGPKIKYFKKAK